ARPPPFALFPYTTLFRSKDPRPVPSGARLSGDGRIPPDPLTSVAEAPAPVRGGGFGGRIGGGKPDRIDFLEQATGAVIDVMAVEMAMGSMGLEADFRQ